MELANCTAQTGVLDVEEVSIQPGLREPDTAPAAVQQLVVTVPAGSSAGQEVFVPHNGRNCIVIIPAGLTAGSTFVFDAADIQSTFDMQEESGDSSCMSPCALFSFSACVLALAIVCLIIQSTESRYAEEGHFVGTVWIVLALVGMVIASVSSKCCCCCAPCYVTVTSIAVIAGGLYWAMFFSSGVSGHKIG